MQQLLKIEYQTEKHTLMQAKMDLEQQLKQHQISSGEKEKSFLQQIKEMKDKQIHLENNIK